MPPAVGKPWKSPQLRVFLLQVTSQDLLQGRGAFDVMKASCLRKRTFRGHERVWDTERGLAAAGPPPSVKWAASVTSAAPCGSPPQTPTLEGVPAAPGPRRRLACACVCTCAHVCVGPQCEARQPLGVLPGLSPTSGSSCVQQGPPPSPEELRPWRDRD